MEEKRCRGKCKNILPLSEFYKHKQMYDGHLNICKSCTKDRVNEHRKENIDKIKEYDRNRPNAKERSKQNCERIKNLSDDKKEQYRKVKKKWCDLPHNKNKKTVNAYTLNAIRDGRLEKQDTCEHCGLSETIEAHHPSYLKPLEVIWLCPSCHGAEHKKMRGN